MHSICCLSLAEDQSWNFHYTRFACQKESLWFNSSGFFLNAKLGMWCSDVFQLLKATTMSHQGNRYLYSRGIALECGITLLRVSHIRGGPRGLEYETGSFCNPVHQALIRSEIPDSSVTVLGKLILLKSSHCVAFPGRGWGKLTELMEYFLAWMSFEKGDCAFVKMTTESICSPQNIAFTPEEYLKTQLYYFLNKNPKALGFWQQISRTQMGEKKKGFVFGKPGDQNIFFFLFSSI